MLNINCDMGESFGNFKIGNDEALMPYINQANIACGFHGGDPYVMEKTVQLALAHSASIGAHPSYPDLAGFGRRKMQIPSAELKSILKYQIAALKGMVESLGGTLNYVKPHGALYNAAAHDLQEATVIISAIEEIDDHLSLMGLAGSPLETFAKQKGFPFIAEAFGDRTYQKNGKLTPRSEQGAVIHDAALAVKQILQLNQEQKVKTSTGQIIDIQSDSICIHGDNPAALEILKLLSGQSS